MYFLAGLLIIILILLFAPFVLHVYYLEDFKLTLSFLFLKMKLFPREKKEKKEEEPKDKKEKKKKKASKAQDKKEEPKKEEKKLSLEEKLKLAVKILKDLKTPFIKFLKRIRITGLKTEIMVSKGDAAETGMAFTKINEAVTALLNLLDHIFTLKAKSIYVYPDFREEKSKYYLECDIKINLFMCLVLLVTVLKRSTKDIMKLMK